MSAAPESNLWVASSSLPTMESENEYRKPEPLQKEVSLLNPVSSSLPANQVTQTGEGEGKLILENASADNPSKEEARSSACKDHQNSGFFLGRDSLNEFSKSIDPDDKPTQAAEVLASLPTLIHVNDPSLLMNNISVVEDILNASNQENGVQSLMQNQGFLSNSHSNTGMLIGNRDPLLASKVSLDIYASQLFVKDSLETLANAALSEQTANKQKEIEKSINKNNEWCDVGIFRGSSCLVSSYNATPSLYPNHDGITSYNLPDFTHLIKNNLEPGTAYKFRVCAVNTCGRGQWSDVSAFRTGFPGYPGAPSSVAISRSAEGAHLSWQPPTNTAGKIVEYTVCLAVRTTAQASGVHSGQKFTLLKVYSGPHTQTVVPNLLLAQALIDTSSKPAIIFRIAAKNEKGFGPPTQVRWLQEVDSSGNIKL